MATEITETERKYDAPQGAALPDLADLPQVAAESDPEEQTLRAVAQISTVRQRRLLLDDAGGSLAEVVADDVSARALGDGAAESRWHEVEVELTGGGPRLLEAADRRLRRSGLRPAGRQAKLERALADRPSPARPSPPQPPAGRPGAGPRPARPG